jgi:transposase
MIRGTTMPKPYSRDLRERVVRSVEMGASCREAAAAFEVSASSAIRWVARWRQSGSVAAKPMGGKRSPLDAHAQWLLELIATEPDLTLEEIRGQLRAGGVKASASSVWRFYDRHDITFKKKPARRRTGPRRRSHGTGRLETRAAAA